MSSGQRVGWIGFAWDPLDPYSATDVSAHCVETCCKMYVSGVTGSFCKGSTDALMIYEENQICIMELLLERVDQSDGCYQFQWDNLCMPRSHAEEDACRRI